MYKEIRNYLFTKVYLNERIFPILSFPMASISIFNKKSTDNFVISTESPFGFASEEKVRKYVIAVHKNIA